MTIINSIKNKEKRRLLRKKSTSEEKIVWDYIRGKSSGLKWRRQVSIGNYIADFYCYEIRTVLEIDGNHHYEQKNLEYDTLRTIFFNSLDIQVVRITNEQARNPHTLSTIVERVASFRKPGEGILKK